MTTTPDGTAARHRALANPTRVRLLEHLRAAPDGADVADLAEAVGLHPNTVRTHLDKLEDAGLVRSAPLRIARRGRPRQRYEAVTDAPGEDDGYRFLATVLAGAIPTGATADPPAAVAEDAGHRWGRQLVTSPGPTERLDDAQRRGRVVAVLDQLGFEPRVEDGHVDLRRCPFRTLARERPDVVCGVHLGILRGALTEVGLAGDEASLEPFVTPTRCVARLPAGGCADAPSGQGVAKPSSDGSTEPNR